jgi:Predicted hydrolases of HD superfamily
MNKAIVLKLFDAFMIQRWSDRIRPLNLVEMDKHAHKAFIAYFLGKYEEEIHKTKIDWNLIIYGSFFALLKNIAVSDIQSPIFDKIKGDTEIIKQLNDWVIKQYLEVLDKDILNEFKIFLETDYDSVSFRILQAAHKLSTYREFRLIKHANMYSPDMVNIEKNLKKSLSNYTDIAGFNEIYFEQNLATVISTIENLRNQIRWGQSVRIPQTSVLGHSFLVASLSLLLSRDLKACNNRVFNNFFCGLFHDVPESLTRDIISPVKQSTPDLPEFISKIEKEIMKNEFYPNLNECVHDDLKYFTTNEFKNKIVVEGKIKMLKQNDNIEIYNKDKYKFMDGELIKLADEIAAFLEAMQSKKYGVNTPHLDRGYDFILKKYTRTKTSVNGINVQPFFDDLVK